MKHEQTSVFNKILIAVLSFGSNDFDSLKRSASSVLLKSSYDYAGKSPSRQLQFFAGRSALASLLNSAKITACIEPHPRFGYLQVVDSAGKPKKEIYANVSHTDQIAVSVLAPHPVGIDVETLDRMAEKAVKRIATKSELELGKKFLMKDQNKSIPFELALWSSKEAFTKALGIGLRGRFSQFQVFLDDKPPVFKASTLLCDTPFKLQDPAVYLKVQNNYLITICTERSKLLSEIDWKIL